jgi:hypothetical protein
MLPPLNDPIFSPVGMTSATLPLKHSNYETYLTEAGSDEGSDSVQLFPSRR